MVKAEDMDATSRFQKWKDIQMKEKAGNLAVSGGGGGGQW